MSGKSIIVGVTVGERGQATLKETLKSVDAAGFEQPWLFPDGEVQIPPGYHSTRRRPKIGGWPNYLLALNELVLRNPNADGILMLQDDVVFSRRVRQYLDGNRMTGDHGIFTLFCPIRYNLFGIGWHQIKSGWGLCGASNLLPAEERDCIPFFTRSSELPTLSPKVWQSGISS